MRGRGASTDLGPGPPNRMHEQSVSRTGSLRLAVTLEMGHDRESSTSGNSGIQAQNLVSAEHDHHDTVGRPDR